MGEDFFIKSIPEKSFYIKGNFSSASLVTFFFFTFSMWAKEIIFLKAYKGGKVEATEIIETPETLGAIKLNLIGV